jgi:hypothetical protein
MASHGESRSTGVACTAGELRDGRIFRGTPSSEDSLIDIEVREDCCMRLFVSRLTASRGMANDGESVIMDGVAIAYSARLLGWINAISQRIDYDSGWMLGICASGLRGLRSVAWSDRIIPGMSGPRYDQDDYTRVLIASVQMMRRDPHTILSRMVGPLLRALGTESIYDQAMHFGSLA